MVPQPTPPIAIPFRITLLVKFFKDGLYFRERPPHPPRCGPPSPLGKAYPPDKSKIATLHHISKTKPFTIRSNTYEKATRFRLLSGVDPADPDLLLHGMLRIRQVFPRSASQHRGSALLCCRFRCSRIWGCRIFHRDPCGSGLYLRDFLYVPFVSRNTGGEQQSNEDRLDIAVRRQRRRLHYAVDLLYDIKKTLLGAFLYLDFIRIQQAFWLLFYH